MKICSRCKEVKSIDNFSPDKRIKSGVQSQCKSCFAEKVKLKRLQDPQKHRDSVKKSTLKHYEKKLARNSEYRANNPEKVKEWKRKDRQNNIVRILADSAYRRAEKNKRTPLWANNKAIQAYYETANALGMITGEWHHVDHIVPLLGKNVCGLHVEHNLQILTAKENLQKGNKL